MRVFKDSPFSKSEVRPNLGILGPGFLRYDSTFVKRYIIQPRHGLQQGVRYALFELCEVVPQDGFISAP